MVELRDERHREKNKRDDQDKVGAMGRFGSKSSTDGDEPNGINFTSGSRGNHQRQDLNPINSKADIGKILSQLRDIEQSHLAYVGAHKKRLETRLNDAEEHERKFKSQVEAVEQQIRDLMESMQE
jgi:hypothetical protein